MWGGLDCFYGLSTGSYISNEGGKPHAVETDSSINGNGHRDLDIQQAVRNQGANHWGEGPSSNFHAVGASSGGHVASPDEEEKAARRRRKKSKKKYLCFVPFYFFFWYQFFIEHLYKIKLS